MDDDRPLGERRRAALARLGALLLLALSPLGAPAIGLILIGACDIAWFEPAQCAVPEPLLTYFVGLTFIPMAAGGLLFALPWLLVAAGVQLACLGQAGKVLWLFLLERPIPGIDFDEEQS